MSAYTVIYYGCGVCENVYAVEADAEACCSPEMQGRPIEDAS